MPAIPSSGAISLSDFATEFGGTAPHSLSEYYRDGGNVPSNNTNVPTSGVFRFGNMRGAINAIIQTLSNTTNVDLSTVFGSDWASSVPKEVIIPSGVTIGGTGSSDALTAPSGMGGTLTITNAGSVIGFGGAAGSAGGNAIRIASSGITVANSGLIAGGGGGGGTGGAGGTGGQGRVTQLTGQDFGIVSGSSPSSTESACTSICTSNGRPFHYTSYYIAGEDNSCCRCYCGQYQYTSGGSGGSGGSAGVGQGYNQSATSGSSGSGGASGGTNAGAGGTGGTGGSGGAYGASGSTGSTGSTGANGNYTNGSSGSAGSSGGAAGAAVIYTAAYTMNNTGTLAGAS